MVGERVVARSRLRVAVVTWSLSDLNEPPRMRLAPVDGSYGFSGGGTRRAIDSIKVGRWF